MMISSFTIFLLTATYAFPQKSHPKIVEKQIGDEIWHILEGDDEEVINPIKKDENNNFRPTILDEGKNDEDAEDFHSTGFASQADLVDTQNKLKKGIPNKTDEEDIFNTKPNDSDFLNDSKVNLHVTINAFPFSSVSVLDLGNSHLLRLLSQKASPKRSGDAKVYSLK